MIPDAARSCHGGGLFQHDIEPVGGFGFNGGFCLEAWIEGGVDHVQKEDADEKDYRDSPVAVRVRVVVPAHRSDAEHQQDCGASAGGAGERRWHRLAVRAKDAGIGWPLPDGVDEDRLEQLLYRSWQPETDAQFDFEWVSREMERKGVTLKLLWQELRDQGYPHSYSWFCRRCQQRESRTRRTMRMRYKLGEAVFVDYPGRR